MKTFGGFMSRQRREAVMKILSFFLALAFLASAQETLTNDSIAKMVKAGLGEGLIVSMIQNQPGKYSLTADDLVKLKQEGLSEKILAAMVSKGAASAPSSSPTATAAPADNDVPQNVDIGVYYKKGGKWEEMLPEVVNWKTGGVIKSIASVGIVKGDVNGHIQGTHSRNSAASPLEVFIYTPEGIAITEYQLLHLREHNNAREFRTVTGGVMHVSGGATRDIVPFEGKKIANRMYRVMLPNLAAGDYGFLPPGAVTSASSASIGKMYTFRLIE
jgi:hypothetical protein